MCISYDNILVDSKSEFYYTTFLALNIIDINNFINSIEFGRFSHKISVLNSILCVNQTLFYNISEWCKIPKIQISVFLIFINLNDKNTNDHLENKFCYIHFFKICCMFFFYIYLDAQLSPYYLAQLLFFYCNDENWNVWMFTYIYSCVCSFAKVIRKVGTTV